MRDIFGSPHERDMRPRRVRFSRRHHHHSEHTGHPEFAGRLERSGHRGGRDMHRGRRGRVPRGDVRAAVLMLLTDEPMHGYQLMQAIADRTGGRWQPSPGAIYPTISQLEDEGLLTLTANAGRKLATLTEAGRAYVTANAGTWVDPFAPFDAPGEEPAVDLRDLLHQLHAAARQVGRTGTSAQIEAAGRLLSDTRRALYLLLAEEPRESRESREPGEPKDPGDTAD